MTITVSSVWKPATLAFLAATVACLLGAIATDLSPWYYALRKPAFQPPDWAFGPVWTTLFALIGISAFKAWRAAPSASSRKVFVIAMTINLLLNTAWSVLFFRLHHPDWALAEVVFLWSSIAVLIKLTWPWSRSASLLLVPYLVWVSLAAVLNLAIVRLNS